MGHTEAACRRMVAATQASHTSRRATLQRWRRAQPTSRSKGLHQGAQQLLHSLRPQLSGQRLQRAGHQAQQGGGRLAAGATRAARAGAAARAQQLEYVGEGRGYQARRHCAAQRLGAASIALHNAGRHRGRLLHRRRRSSVDQVAACGGGGCLQHLDQRARHAGECRRPRLAVKLGRRRGGPAAQRQIRQAEAQGAGGAQRQQGWGGQGRLVHREQHLQVEA